jgi:hypothetical protein
MSMLVAAAALSSLGLAIGPGLIALGHGHQRARAAIAGFTFGAIPPLVVTHLLPHLYKEAGSVVPLLAVAGYAAAAWLDHGGRRFGGQAAFVLPVLAVHSVLDGAALASALAVHGEDSAARVLGVALIAHRVPEGLLIGAAFVPRVGLRVTLQLTGLLIAATLLGVLGGAAVLVRGPWVATHALIALVLGTFLRSVMHGDRAPSEHGAGTTEALASLAGTASILALSWRHGALGVLITSLVAALIRSGHRAGSGRGDDRPTTVLGTLPDATRLLDARTVVAHEDRGGASKAAPSVD